MKPTLTPGATAANSLVVADELTVPHASPLLGSFADMPKVFATAFMVAFLESTAIDVLRPHLEEGEHSVGTHIDVSHVAATPVGMTVRAEATVTEVDGRTVWFDVAAYDDAGLIGKGRHQRAIIDVAKFLARVDEKAEAAGLGA